MQPLIDLFKQGLVLILLVSAMNYSPQRLRGLKDTPGRPRPLNQQLTFGFSSVNTRPLALTGDTWTWSS